MDKELKIKDETIKALKAEIKAKDAEIARWKADTASAIAKAYAALRKHADKMTEDSRRLSEQVEKLSKVNQLNESSEAVEIAIAEHRTVMVAMRIVGEQLKACIPLDSPLPSSVEIIEGFVEVFKQFSFEAQTRGEKAQELVAALKIEAA